MGKDDASGTNFPLLIYDGSGDLEGGITLTAGTVAIYDVSDETKKQNIVDSNTNNILQNFKDLRVVDFEFKKIPNVTHTSFLAQDINNYFPEAYVYKPERTYIEKTLRVIETGLEITYKETELIKATYLVESEGEITEEVSELIDGKEIINEVTRKVSVFTDSRTDKTYYNPSDWFEEYYEEFEKTVVEPEFIGTSKSAMIPQLALGLKEIITVDENQSTEIQELQNQVTILQNELCKKDITYAWCEPIGEIS